MDTMDDDKVFALNAFIQSVPGGPVTQLQILTVFCFPRIGTIEEFPDDIAPYIRLQYKLLDLLDSSDDDYTSDDDGEWVPPNPDPKLFTNDNNTRTPVVNDPILTRFYANKK